MIDNDRAQAILALEHSFITNLPELQNINHLQDKEDNEEGNYQLRQNEIDIANSLSVIETHINIIKNRIFSLFNNEDKEHMKNLYNTGLFPVEVLCRMYQCGEQSVLSAIKEIELEREIKCRDYINEINKKIPKHERELIKDKEDVKGDVSIDINERNDEK